MIDKIIKPSFAVIGKEGSTNDGEGFIQKLWNDANTHFSEISDIIKRDSDGNPIGIWGAMSDLSRSFMPWENNFTKGLYLAGAECGLDTISPDGWVKWIIPSFEYLRVENNHGNSFETGLSIMKDNNYELAGAIQELTVLSAQKEYLYFPIKRI